MIMHFFELLQFKIWLTFFLDTLYNTCMQFTVLNSKIEFVLPINLQNDNDPLHWDIFKFQMAPIFLLASENSRNIPKGIITPILILTSETARNNTC